MSFIKAGDRPQHQARPQISTRLLANPSLPIVLEQANLSSPPFAIPPKQYKPVTKSSLQQALASLAMGDESLPLSKPIKNVEFEDCVDNPKNSKIQIVIKQKINKSHSRSSIVPSKTFSNPVYPTELPPTQMIVGSSKALKNPKTKFQGHLQENSFDNILPSSRLLYNTMKKISSETLDGLTRGAFDEEVLETIIIDC
ncbi:uncharacterized protein MELLADRAFT_114334 [Melampsora larici-populina 98AG31]|uniref:Uncharacterized protein n=1 Tax=Melampsora larici-populina (strain 98AG31 / pathotype 3-4-7) TaxID=747676 RepID=F4SD28_MELLP|nr:uncharacterized protein MELLADRAFT_114334 [Melampsora larici-populina 98AG31]EGF97452.1 hypothetical protein MELLADRAFT_114334 [Melampsora larici-populina 98AG31]